MSEEVKKKEGKKTYLKSRQAYPPYSLKDAVAFVSILEKLGGRNVSEAVLLKELGIRGGPTTKSFWGKSQSGKQFGLLMMEGKNYTLTDWAKLILRPKDEDSKKSVLMDSFMTPELYKDLCEKFGGQAIPPVDTLANILYHDYGININASSDAAKAFIDSVIYVGLLDAGNVLLTPQKEESATAQTTPMSSIQKSAKPAGTLTIPVILSKGKASIVLPEDGISKSDYEKLKKAFEFLELYIAEEPKTQETQ